VKTLERESASKLKENDGNAQFSLCCYTSTKCRIASEARSGIFLCLRIHVRIARTQPDWVAHASRVSGEGVPLSRTFCDKDCFGETPKPTRETRALPNHRISARRKWPAATKGNPPSAFVGVFIQQSLKTQTFSQRVPNRIPQQGLVQYTGCRGESRNL
jgi:hypothetical protein